MNQVWSKLEHRDVHMTLVITQSLPVRGRTTPRARTAAPSNFQFCIWSPMETAELSGHDRSTGTPLSFCVLCPADDARS